MRFGFGVDVGGTTVKLGLFSEDGALLEKWELPTRTEQGGRQILPDIAEAVAQCMRRHALEHGQAMGLGIGVPGPVDADGVVNRCVNLNWGVFHLRLALEELTGLPVRAGNDANLAALGEHWDGGGRGSASSLLVTLGTGVGGGFVSGGRVLNGAHGVAGEIGHITVNPMETERCTCGKRGCVEQYASATGIVRMAAQRLRGGEVSALRDAPLDCRRVFACAAEGDAVARAVVEQAYAYLGQAIADACCICDPELVILGGGVSRAGVPLLRGVEEQFRRRMFHASRDTRFALAKLGNNAGIYGAFRLLQQSIG